MSIKKAIAQIDHRWLGWWPIPSVSLFKGLRVFLQYLSQQQWTSKSHGAEIWAWKAYPIQTIEHESQPQAMATSTITPFLRQFFYRQLFWQACLQSSIQMALRVLLGRLCFSVAMACSSKQQYRRSHNSFQKPRFSGSRTLAIKWGQIWNALQIESIFRLQNQHSQAHFRQAFIEK